MLSEVDKVLKIFFTFPVTNATAERSFSSLMRLRHIYLKSTMTHCRLNYLFIQQELMHNLEKIAEDYILVLFWKNLSTIYV